MVYVEKCHWLLVTAISHHLVSKKGCAITFGSEVMSEVVTGSTRFCLRRGVLSLGIEPDA